MSHVTRVAFIVAEDCPEVRTWSLSSRKVVRLGHRHCPPATSTGSTLYGLSFAGETAFWATYAGGDVLEYSLWASRFDRQGFRRLVSVSRDADDTVPLVTGEGGSYAVDGAIFLGGRLVWRTSARPLALVAEAPYVAVIGADGRVTIVGEWGEILSTLDYAAGVVRGVKISGALVVVLRPGFLDIHGVYYRGSTSWRLPRARTYGDGRCGLPRCRLAELRLEDVQGSLAVYVRGRAIHLLRLTDGKDVIVRRPAGSSFVHAQLEATGLFYTATGRVAFVPMRELRRYLS